ncbi:MAG: serine/threonine protein phosphatase [Deltaproteobacteria bacterium]|nr:serine/threonine protein phosphatase [Deltaproteobacteria bacterium]
MNQETLFEEVEKILVQDSRLIHLLPEGKVVFVGDTHGDLDASEQVLRRYLKKPYRIVFLGDYVDRGDESEENINYLFHMKIEHPEDIFLLSGNHEGQMIKELRPANFWESLSIQEKKQYGRVFSTLPLCAASANGLVALHGALPELKSLEEINQIEWGDSNWDRIVWGDFVEGDGDLLGDSWGRPQFGGAYFDRLMERYRKKILVRSHQPLAPSLMFKKRCITIFTSQAYPLSRTIVIADLEKEIRDAGDVIVERI